MERLRGPASFSTNEECAMLVDGFDSPPRVMMPYNPAYYPELLEAAGFTKAKDLVAYMWMVEDYPDSIPRLAERIAKREKVSIRSLNMKRYQQEIERFTVVYNQAWEKNWGFVPMTDEEILHMAKALRPVINPDLILFLEKEGEAIGFAMALPDMNLALRHANGRLFPFGLFKILYHAKRIRIARVMVLGLLDAYRGKAFDLLLYDHLIRNGRRHGFIGSEFSWILEDNAAIRKPIEKMGGRVYKTYRFYERGLE
jgi:hypothetical protein